MTLGDGIIWLQRFFPAYFVALSGGYIMLTLLSIGALKRRMAEEVLEYIPRVYTHFEPPISLLVPGYNEEATIAASVRSLLQLNYPEFEIVVINDGSKDRTLEVLKREFALQPAEEAPWVRVKCKPVRGIYRSPLHPNLRVLDKENGGKADALNAGINASHYPLFCAMDADSVLQRDSLQRVVRPFLEDPNTIAAGGTVRIANGCQVSGGFLTAVGLPRNPLALVQIVEYLRAFLFGRLGWTLLNAVLIISGAFGLFRKESVVVAGGYRTDTVGEDMELIVRLHRLYRTQGRPYRIAFLPDPICWTEAPESLRVLKSQRIRWQRGLAESLTMNLRLLFHPRGGAPGWIAFPFMMLFEWLGPLIEVLGYLLMGIGFVFGVVSGQAFGAFIIVALGLGFLLSVISLLLEEISFHIYARPSHLALLVLALIVENVGYRQINSVWRLIGLARWIVGAQARWGEMTRKASWQRPQ